MKVSHRAYGGLVLAASLACLSTFAAAQDRPDAPPSPPSANQRAAWKQDWQAHRQQAMAERAHHLHDILNLRPDQDAALNAMLEALAPAGHRDEMKHEGPQAMEGLTTPQRLDQMAARMAEHDAAFQRRSTAIKQFYAALSPEQQRAFDALPALIGGGHHMGGGGWERDGRGPGEMGRGHMEPDGPQGPDRPQ
jgi:hypothetical protein